MTISKRVKIAKLLIISIAVILIGSTVLSVVCASPVSLDKSLSPYAENQSLFATIDLEKTVIGGLFCIVAFFIVRLIGKYDKRHEEHSEKLDHLLSQVGTLCQEFSHLKGEHDAVMSQGWHRRTSD